MPRWVMLRLRGGCVWLVGGGEDDDDEEELLVAVPPLSNWRRTCHRDVLLGNFPVRRRLPSESGSWRARETTDGEREDWMSSSWAWLGRLESRMVRERSRGLPLCLWIYG